VIHNPDDRRQKLCKQVAGLLELPKDVTVWVWYGVFRQAPRKRRAPPRYSRSPWGPGYSCMNCEAQKPERAVRKALAYAKWWRKNVKGGRRDPQPS
jgi:hypothetical protein